MDHSAGHFLLKISFYDLEDDARYIFKCVINDHDEKLIKHISLEVVHLFFGPLTGPLDII